MSFFSEILRLASGHPNQNPQLVAVDAGEQTVHQAPGTLDVADTKRSLAKGDAALEPRLVLVVPRAKGRVLHTDRRGQFLASVRRLFAAKDPVAVAHQQAVVELAAVNAAMLSSDLAPLRRCEALVDFLSEAEGDPARMRTLVLPERPEQAPLAQAARSLLQVPTLNNAQGFQLLADLLVPTMLRAVDGLGAAELKRQFRPALAATATALAAAHADAVAHADSLPPDFLAALAVDSRLCWLLAAGSEADHAVNGHGYPKLFSRHSRDPIGEAVELAREIIAPTGLGSLVDRLNLADFPALADALAALQAETAIFGLCHVVGLELRGGAGPGRRSLTTLLVEVHAASAAACQRAFPDVDERLQELSRVTQQMLQVQGGAAEMLEVLVWHKQKFARASEL